MRARRVALATVVVGSLFAGRSEAQVASDWKQIQPPPLHAFAPRMPTRVVLPNGLVLLLLEDHELPLVDGSISISGGSRDEPKEKVGLVQIYGQAWRTGGTASRTGDALDDYLEARAAKLETSGGFDQTSLGWNCLKQNLDETLTAVVDLLQHPAFREDKIALAKMQMNTGISRRNDDASGIVGREGAKLVYGADSPLARTAEYATVAAVTRADLLGWHKQYVHPNNMIVGVVGDFDAKAMEAKLRKAFGSWPRGPAVVAPDIRVPDPKPGVYFVAKDDVTSSNVRLLDVGIVKNNPDYFAVEVFNQFFGEGFSSRLFSEVRSKKGLAYSVDGSIGAGYVHPGVTRLAAGTKSASTAATIDALRAEIDRLKTTPCTPEELAQAKSALLNSFVFLIDSSDKILDWHMTFEKYGYPRDFLERYRKGVDAVTVDDVARIAEKYLHKDRMRLLVVGKAADFDRPLSSFGEVQTLDITIPPPPGSRGPGVMIGPGGPLQ
jgi:zinc protease